MNSQETIGAPWDFIRFSKRLDGDVELMRELADLYISEYPRQLSELESAMTSRDARRFRRAAHTIKGTATNFAAAPLAKAAAVLEEIGEGANLSSGLEAMRQLTVELQRLHLALAAFLGSPADTTTN